MEAEGYVEADFVAAENSTHNIDVETVAENVESSMNEDEAEVDAEEPVTNDGRLPEKENASPQKRRLVRLPLARIKHIIKSDPDCTIVSQETVFLVTKATEYFLEYLGKESVKHTLAAKRKTVQKRDVDAAIDSIAHLCFLEGALD